MQGHELVGKYQGGTRVRIRGGNWLCLSPHSDIWKYDNLTGEVANSEAVVGPLARTLGDANEALQFVHLYRVRLDVGVEVDQVTEDCLEPLATAKS